MLEGRMISRLNWQLEILNEKQNFLKSCILKERMLLAI